MGRPRKSAADLIRSNARRGRIVARQKEEALLLAAPEILDFLDAVRQEHSSFAARCVPGESIAREIGGTVFDWSKDHWLTDARAVAEEIVANSTYDWPDTKRDCKAFLDNLNSGASRGVVIDPAGAKTAQAAVFAFAPKDFKLWRISLLDLTEYFATKTDTGTYVFKDRADMGFDESIEEILTSASATLHAADIAVVR